MTMRKGKLAILAFAVLLKVHTGAGYLFAQNAQNPQPNLSPGRKHFAAW